MFIDININDHDVVKVNIWYGNIIEFIISSFFDDLTL